MKALISQDVHLAYPDLNKPFHIYTDASDYQLGDMLQQEGLHYVKGEGKVVADALSRVPSKGKETLTPFLPR